ncbi:PAS domain S-box protein [Lacinutrix cladophorae]
MEAIKYNMPDSMDDSVWANVIGSSMVSITDALGRIEFASDAFSEILECQKYRLVGETHELLKSPLHTGEFYKNLWRTIKMGNKWSGVLTDVNSSGRVFWLDTEIIPFRKKGEKNYKYLCLYKNVTNYYKEREVLKKQELVNESFLQGIPLNVFVVSRYGKILNTNKSFCKKEAQELIGTYVYDYFSPSSFQSFKNNIDKVFVDKKKHQFELHDLNTDGEKIFFSVISSPNFNSVGEIVSTTIALNEVTEFKNVSDQLKNSEEKFRKIYQSINIGVVVVADEKGSITEWNKGAEATFGYSEKEIIGSSLTMLMSEKYRNKNIAGLLRGVDKIKNQKEEATVKMCCLRKNGEQFPVEFTLSYCKVGEVGFYSAMMLDISQRKELENKLIKKTEDLELLLKTTEEELIKKT